MYRIAHIIKVKVEKSIKQLRALLTGLTKSDLERLRSVINGKLSKRTLSPEALAKMREGKRLAKLRRERGE